MLEMALRSPESQLLLSRLETLKLALEGGHTSNMFSDLAPYVKFPSPRVLKAFVELPNGDGEAVDPMPCADPSNMKLSTLVELELQHGAENQESLGHFFGALPSLTSLHYTREDVDSFLPTSTLD